MNEREQEQERNFGPAPLIGAYRDEAVSGQRTGLPAEVVLPKATQLRLRGIGQQADTQVQAIQDAAQKAIFATVTIALEAMGITGTVQAVDMATGVVTLAPAPAAGE